MKIFISACCAFAAMLATAYATDGRMAYRTTDGSYRAAIPTVPVCSVDDTGAPQVCDFSGISASSLANYYTKTAADTQFLSLSSAASTYATTASLSDYLLASVASETYATQAQLTAETAARTAADAQMMPMAGGTFSGPVAAPTPAATDNSKNIATTAFVYDLLSSVDTSVTGDVSTSGGQISMPIGDSGVIATLAYSASGAASMTCYAASASIAPVDIRRNSIWGGSAVETFTLDGGTLTTTGTVADSTIYTASNDSSAYFIRVAGNVYFLTVWASGNGARAFIGLHRMI
ncbi:hypothetical protein [Komagataeibacter saccharivorans]|uniref:hypothetical protein n=1 Tax=Komagataeibacter saccharivorans TaxID=265959 RepID=UPI000C853F35|nr:hypothetical protein [Komagataeibacter saccharivorans]